MYDLEGRPPAHPGPVGERTHVLPPNYGIINPADYAPATTTTRSYYCIFQHPLRCRGHTVCCLDKRSHTDSWYFLGLYTSNFCLNRIPSTYPFNVSVLSDDWFNKTHQQWHTFSPKQTQLAFCKTSFNSEQTRKMMGSSKKSSMVQILLTRM